MQTETRVEKNPTAAVPQPRHRRRLSRQSAGSVNGSRTSLRSFTLVKETEKPSVVSSEDKAKSKVPEKQGSLKSESSGSLSEGDFSFCFNFWFIVFSTCRIVGISYLNLDCNVLYLLVLHNAFRHFIYALLEIVFLHSIFFLTSNTCDVKIILIAQITLLVKFVELSPLQCAIHHFEAETVVRQLSTAWMHEAPLIDALSLYSSNI